MGNRKSYGQKEQLPRAHLCLVLNDLGMVCVWKPHSPCLFPLEWISAPLSVPAPGCSAQASPRPCWGDGAEQPLDGRQAPAQRLGCSAWGPEWLRGLREFGGLRELGGLGSVAVPLTVTTHKERVYPHQCSSRGWQACFAPFTCQKGILLLSGGLFVCLRQKTEEVKL